MRRSLMLMTLPLLLQAQEAVTYTTRVGAGSAIPFFSATERPALLVLDDGRGTWTTAFRKLFSEAPLAEWSLGVHYLNGKAEDKRSQETRTKYGWGPEARWAYVAGGAVKATGTTLPTAPALMTSLQGAGHQDPTQALVAFCVRHPDHAEAQVQLLEAYHGRAERYMRRVLPAPAETSAARVSIQIAGMSASSGMAEPEPTRALTPAEDKQFWGLAEQQLRRVMRSAGWFEPQAAVVVPALARHSALMKAACQATLAPVEDQLRKFPGHEGLWRTWASMARVAGGRSLRTLLGTLEAVPGSGELPPDPALDLYVKECREGRAWAELKDLLLPRWREFSSSMGRLASVLRRMGGGAQERDAFKETWDRTLEPLVEACLRQGDGATADAVVEEALQVFQSRNLPMWASQLAIKCGQPQAAQRWAALKAPERAG